MQKLRFEDLGKMDYKSAWDYQELLLQRNVSAKAEARALNLPANTEHSLLFVEHPPVYTLGKSGKAENLLISEEECRQRGIEYYPINRGGDITFHGLEQLVGYPILDLERFYTDIGKYLRNLEEVIIRSLREFGIEGERSGGETGVWIEPGKKGAERKICAIGVRCSRWVTMHGFALNVNTDLAYFDNIIPCGIQDKRVTSMEYELGRPVNFDEAKDVVRRNFAAVFEVEVMEVSSRAAV